LADFALRSNISLESWTIVVVLALDASPISISIRPNVLGF